jgi:acyl-CoA hydrolase
MSSSRTTDLSETTMTEVVCPNDTNPMGMLQGGRLVQWMDIAGAICAQRHAEQICVTSYIDGLSFMASAKVGDIITVKAKITRAFNTSMEINVKAWSKNIHTKEASLINEAHFIFVAIGPTGTPVQVPSLKPVTDEELIAYQQAGARRAGFKKK